MMKKLLLLMLAGFLYPNLIKAQTPTLVVWLADGTIADVELYTEPKVTFSNDKLFIRSTILDIEYKATDVVRFTYKGKGTGIDGVQAEADYEQHDGHIVFHGISATDKVAVYRPDGIRLPVRAEQQGSDTVLHLSAIPVGVYLINVNGRTSKFIWK